MKKPGKPKPKRRAHAAAASRTASPKAAQAVGHPRLETPVAVARAVSVPVPRARTVTTRQPDDRAAFALMLVPFLIVAVFLGMMQSRRAGLPMLPEFATRPAPERIAVAPQSAPATPRIEAPRVETPPQSPVVTLPGPLPVYPPPLPEITVAAAEVRSPIVEAPLPVTPAIVPMGSIAYPPPLPEITVAAADARPPIIAAPLPETLSIVPAGTIAYPPPLPEITVAAADVRLPIVEAPLPVMPPIVPKGSIAYPPPLPEIAVASVDPRPPGPLLPVAPIPQPTTTAGDAFCAPSPAQLASFQTAGRLARATRMPRLTGVDAETFGRRLSAAALAQTEDLVIYTARYQPMAYPLGDVMALHGACIDVVIRAYRALGIDLQEEVQRARPSRGDPNIDHRRTENMRRFFERHGTSLPISTFPEDYKPGDIVTYHRPFSRVSTSHIAIVTDVLAATGRPMIVHNRGYGPQLEDALFVDRITGHYRYMGGRAPASGPAQGPTTGQAPPAQSGTVVRASYPAR